jgi:hypothetical protein
MTTARTEHHYFAEENSSQPWCAHGLNRNSWSWSCIRLVPGFRGPRLNPRCFFRVRHALKPWLHTTHTDCLPKTDMETLHGNSGVLAAWALWRLALCWLAKHRSRWRQPHASALQVHLPLLIPYNGPSRSHSLGFQRVCWHGIRLSAGWVSTYSDTRTGTGTGIFFKNWYQSGTGIGSILIFILFYFSFWYQPGTGIMLILILGWYIAWYKTGMKLVLPQNLPASIGIYI